MKNVLSFYLWGFFSSYGNRDSLSNELEKLGEEQENMESDVSNIRLRWHEAREDKVKAASVIRDVKKAEEDLEHLAEEKIQLELDEKVYLCGCGINVLMMSLTTSFYAVEMYLPCQLELFCHCNSRAMIFFHRFSFTLNSLLIAVHLKLSSWV